MDSKYPAGYLASSRAFLEAADLRDRSVHHPLPGVPVVGRAVIAGSFAVGVLASLAPLVALVVRFWT